MTQNSWQAALSTGALAHMPSEDVQLYAATYEGIRQYSAMQTQCLLSEGHVKAFFLARRQSSLSPAELSEGTERLLLYQMNEHILQHVGSEMRSGLQDGLKR